MKKLLAIVLCLTMLSVAMPAMASPALFGEEVQPLTTEQMEEVDGEFKAILIGAAVGAGFGATSSVVGYFVTTPRTQWSARSVVNRAIDGAIGGAFGSFGSSVASRWQ